MSLVTSKLGRFALSLAASGGAALLLAGTAAAASPVTLTTSHDASQTGTSITDVQSSQSTVSSQTTVVTPSVSDATGTTPGGSSGGADVVSPTNLPDATATSGTPADTAASAVSNAGVITTAPAAIAPGGPQPATTPTATELALSTPISQSVIRQARISATAITMPDAPVQLAPQIPLSSSSPNPPVPPKSNGLLNVFSAALAGVVVPELFHPLLAAPTLPVNLTLLSVLTLVATLLSLIALTYGQILRRSGYATAARSDVAPRLSFATPNLMDYELARVP